MVRILRLHCGCDSPEKLPKVASEPSVVKMAVSEPPDGDDDDPKPPHAWGAAAASRAAGAGRSLVKKLSHATLASVDGGGLAGLIPALARRRPFDLTLTSGEAVPDAMCLSAVAPFEAAEDDEAAEPLLPDETSLLHCLELMRFQTTWKTRAPMTTLDATMSAWSAGRSSR